MPDFERSVDLGRLTRTFLDLLIIDSPSGEEAAIAADLAARLRSLGLSPEIDPHQNVLARLEGSGLPMLLCAHIDNVPPCRGVKPVREGDVVRSDGTTVLGADDKSGVAAILEAVAILQERRLPHPPLEIVLTAREESGLFGAKLLDYSWFRAKQGIVIDGGRPITEVTTQAPSSNSFDIEILGRAAHAGVEPEKGANAILAAGEAIYRMPLGRIDFETTANVGIIEGGQARNIVPARCRFLAETRSHNPVKLEYQTGLMLKAIQEAAARNGATAEIKSTLLYEAFAVAADDPLMQRLVRAGERMGVRVTSAASGGGSDANVFSQHGIKCVIMGTGTEGAHTVSESILLSDLADSTELLLRALTEA